MKTEKWLKIGTLSLLYFVQGAPYGFQSSCLPIVLRRGGLSFTQLGVMKLLFLPWILKPLYSPLIDNTMTKKFWLTVTMASLALTCFITGFFISISNTLPLAVVLLLMNFFSASQDITVDSLAVNVLEADEVGIGNTVQVVAYKAGSIFAGSLLLLIQDFFGWAWMMTGFGLTYILAILLMFRMKLVERSEGKKSSESEEKGDIVDVLEEVLKTRGTKWMFGFVLFYKLCERAEQTFSLFLVDKKVSTQKIAAWSTIMKTCSLIGSGIGGYKVSSGKQPVAVITGYSALRAVAILLQFVIIILWGKQPLSNDSILSSDWTFMNAGFLLLCVVLFCAGAITTATFSMMMALSKLAPQKARGTHYTTLSTFEVLGKLSFAAISGFMLDVVGFDETYCSFVIFAFLTIPFIRSAPASVTKATP